MNITMTRVARALRALLVVTAVCGVAYTAVITGVAALVFPHQAGGSLIEENGRVVGSQLISQPQSDVRYLHGRFDKPSCSTAGKPCGIVANEAVASQSYRHELVKRAHGARNVPIELVTGSASGVDPNITRHAAYTQIARIAKARHMNPADVKLAVDRYTKDGLVNVLEVNRALDGQSR